MNISRYLDSAILKPDMTPEQVREAIKSCIAYESRTVCVRGCDIALAKSLCRGTKTDVSCVLDFPYGYGGAETKKAAAAIYADMGVVEIDMVMNYGYALGGEWELVKKEIEGVVKEAHKRRVGVKIIFETSQMNVDQIKKGTEICIAAGADFVKTSTGFNGCGATVEAVQAMLDAAGGRIKVKASGGIRDYQTAEMYIKMGVERLGVGFSSVKAICEGVGFSTEAY